MPHSNPAPREPALRDADNPSNGSPRRSLWMLLVVAAVALIGYLSTGEIPTETIGALLGNQTPVETGRAQQAEPAATPNEAPAPSATAPQAMATQPKVTQPDATQAAAQPIAPLALPQYEPISGLPLVLYADLPAEAHETITLIARDGPFPYEKDGATFQNRERVLPAADRGYYREYTVETPGSRDRGARRIVDGADGELYYTDDHYDSFREVVPEGMEP